MWIATTIVVVHKLDWRVKKTAQMHEEMLRFTLAVHLFTGYDGATFEIVYTCEYLILTSSPGQ